MDDNQQLFIRSKTPKTIHERFICSGGMATKIRSVIVAGLI